MNTNECWENGKSIALWTKIPPTISETVSVFSFGNQLSYGAGLWLYYDANVNKMKVEFSNFNRYTAEFNVTLGEWIHVALVISPTTIPTLYVNGSLVETLTSIGVTPDAEVTNNHRYFGTGEYITQSASRDYSKS